MRARFSSLTTRGRAFLAAGVAAAGCAVVLAQDDLLRVAIFLVALPVLTCLVVARTRFRIAATRSVVPSRVQAGQPATVHLRLENGGRVPTGMLLLEDQVGYLLGARPRFVLDRVSARWTRDVSYEVRSDVRGRFRLGPLTLRVTDPFGLVDLDRSFHGTDTLLVTPQVHQLPTLPLPGEWALRGDRRPRAAGADGSEAVTVREYHDGDDLRRVHWRSSARRGELMVRREEQPWQRRATLFLDTRQDAHRGSGSGSSFEWAVSAAASIGVHLLRRAYAVQLATDAGLSVSTLARESASTATGEAMLLESLSTVPHSRLRSVGQADIAVPNDGSYGTLVAVLGAIDDVDVETMVRLRQRASSGLAIVVDPRSWAQAGDPSPGDSSLDDRVRMLQHGGWRVAVAGRRSDLANLWRGLLLGRPTAAPAPTTTRRAS